MAITALLAIFAGCKGESPTAPPPLTGTTGTSGGSGSTGGTPPPTGSTVTLTASSATPLTNSTSTITATVTQNGAAVPNGTAVEFTTATQGASFTDTADNPTTLIRTTNNGVASVTVTSTVAGPVVVTATVNNVTQSITVTFRDPVIPPTPQPTNPTITGVTPALGLPTGNQQIVITGTNFRAPVRVLFDAGNGTTPREGFVTNVTPTAITVITPAIDLGSGQQQAVNIIVITEAGTANEQRVTKTAAFTYQALVLTPVVRAVSPTEGPIDGGTRVTIIGDGFEAAAQVFFNSAQAQVLTVDFHQIVVIAPAGRDTLPKGNGPVTGPVDIKVLNVNSGKSTLAAAAFRYVNGMQITAVTPNQGPFTGGTRVRIDGTGFVGPVTVYLDGIEANVISVLGSEIVAISNGIAVSGCSDATGPIVVTNVNNGDTATAPVQWIYRILKPVVVSTSGTATAGGTATVTVLNAVGTPRITLGGSGGVAAPISGAVDNGNGTTTYTIQVPLSAPLSTQACGVAGANGPIPTALDVTYTSLTTTCTDTLTKGILVSPAQTPNQFISPSQFTPFTATITPGNASAVPPTPATVTQPPAQTITIVNTGAGPLQVTGVSTTCAQNSSAANVVNVVLPAVPQTLNECDATQITARYNGSTAPGSAQCTVTLTTSSGTKTFQLSGSSQ